LVALIAFLCFWVEIGVAEAPLHEPDIRDAPYRVIDETRKDNCYLPIVYVIITIEPHLEFLI
jgi:hypothetical protein